MLQATFPILQLKPVKSVFFNTLGACDVILTPYMGHTWIKCAFLHSTQPLGANKHKKIQGPIGILTMLQATFPIIQLQPVTSVFFNSLGACDIILTLYMCHTWINCAFLHSTQPLQTNKHKKSQAPICILTMSQATFHVIQLKPEKSVFFTPRVLCIHFDAIYRSYLD